MIKSSGLRNDSASGPKRRLRRTGVPKAVIIVGAGQGGLVASIYARLRGHQVLILDPTPGGKAAPIQEGDYRLDPGPSIIILTELYDRVFRDAGRKREDYLTFQRLRPLSRVCFEGSEPLDLPDGRNQAEQLVAGLDAADGKNFAELMSKLDEVAPAVEKSVFAHPYDRIWQLIDPQLIKVGARFNVRQTYREMVDGWFRTPLLRAFFYGFPSYGGQSYRSKAPGALLIPYYMLQNGVWYPDGGVAAIPQAFRRLAEELGVEFRAEKVTEVEKEGSRITAVRTNLGARYEAESFISNLDRLTFGEMVGRSAKMEPSYSYFTVHWGVRKPLPQVEHHTLLVPKSFEQGFESLYDTRTFATEPIVYLNNTSMTDPTVAPKGKTNLFAVVTSPAMEDHLDWPANQERLADNLEAQLRTFGIDVAETDFRRIQTPVYFQQQHGNHRGSLYGPDEKHRILGGLFPLSNRDDEFKNLFYCGGSVQPGAGLPMVTLGGRFAAEML